MSAIQILMLPLGVIVSSNSFAGTYDGYDAADYALDYCGIDGGMSTSGYNSSYISYPSDCTNFISQSLYEGGWDEVGSSSWWDNHKWYYNGSGAHPNSYSWSAVSNFKAFMEWSGRAIGPYVVNGSSISLSQPGDIVLADWEGNGSWDHIYIVTGVSGGDLQLAAHTTNRCGGSFGTQDVWSDEPNAVLKVYYLLSSY